MPPDKPYNGPFIVHSTRPYTSPVHLTQPFTPPTMPHPIKEKHGSFEIFIGISREIQNLGYKEWSILLHKTDSIINTCRSYSLTSGPKDGAQKGYEKHFSSHEPFPPLEDKSFHEKRIPCGTIQEENLLWFEELFRKTRPGPNNYFVLRFLRKLTKYGLLCEHDAGMVLTREVEPLYNRAEIEYFHGRFTQDDEDYLAGYDTWGEGEGGEIAMQMEIDPGSQ